MSNLLKQFGDTLQGIVLRYYAQRGDPQVFIAQVNAKLPTEQSIKSERMRQLIYDEEPPTRREMRALEYAIRRLMSDDDADRFANIAKRVAIGGAPPVTNEIPPIITEPPPVTTPPSVTTLGVNKNELPLIDFPWEPKKNLVDRIKECQQRAIDEDIYPNIDTYERTLGKLVLMLDELQSKLLPQDRPTNLNHILNLGTQPLNGREICVLLASLNINSKNSGDFQHALSKYNESFPNFKEIQGEFNRAADYLVFLRSALPQLIAEAKKELIGQPLIDNYKERALRVSNSALRKMLKDASADTLKQAVAQLNRGLSVSIEEETKGTGTPASTDETSHQNVLQVQQRVHERPEWLDEVPSITLEELQTWLKGSESRSFKGLKNPEAVDELLKISAAEDTQKQRLGYKLMGILWPPEATTSEQLAFAITHQMEWRDFLNAQRCAHHFPSDVELAREAGLDYFDYRNLKNRAISSGDRELKGRSTNADKVAKILGLTDHDDAAKFRQFAFGIPFSYDQTWLEAQFLPDVAVEHFPHAVSEDKHRVIVSSQDEKINLGARDKDSRAMALRRFFSALRMRLGLRNRNDLATMIIAQLPAQGEHGNAEHVRTLPRMIGSLVNAEGKIVNDGRYATAIAVLAFPDNEDYRKLCVDFLTNKEKYHLSNAEKGSSSRQQSSERGLPET